MAKQWSSLEKSRFAPPKRSSWILHREFRKRTHLGDQAKATPIPHLAIVSPSHTCPPPALHDNLHHVTPSDFKN
jgi:hypothetical protein